jgi:hypothetical protein
MTAMSQAEWLAKVAADRPPLSAAQIALLRPVLAPAVPRIKENAAPTAEAGAAPESLETEPWKDTA